MADHRASANFSTMSLEVMMMSCGIDTKLGRYVIVTDIPGAFLHVNMNDTVNMVLEGTISEQIA